MASAARQPFGARVRPAVANRRKPTPTSPAAGPITSVATRTGAPTAGVGSTYVGPLPSTGQVTTVATAQVAIAASTSVGAIERSRISSVKSAPPSGTL